jgi:glycine oxidase
VNVCIIGAGIVGASIAFELASRGARVRVLDPRGVGRGATHASAGILAPHVEGHSEALLRLGVCSLGLYEEFVARIEADSGEPVEFERSGTLQVALDEAEVATLTAAAGALTSARVGHSLLDAAAASRLEPRLTGRALAALLIPDHAYVAASALTSAAARAATRHGAVFSTARAVRVEDGHDTMRVVTAEPDEAAAADAVVVAAGVWSSIPPRSAPVKPVRGQLLRLSVDERPASRVIWGTRCYAVSWRDGTVLVGATMEDAGFDERATVEGVRGLVDAAIELMPTLRSARFEEVRVGLRPMLPDELPAIGRSASTRNLFFATGHFRNGVLLAPLTARLIADLVLDGREHPELALARPSRVGL